jgi:hypothetical protein
MLFVNIECYYKSIFGQLLFPSFIYDASFIPYNIVVVQVESQ